MASIHTIERQADGQLLLTGKCPFSGKEWMLVVDEAAYRQWQQGMLVQRAFPDLNVDQRELLISGVVSEEWDRVAGNEDE